MPAEVPAPVGAGRQPPPPPLRTWRLAVSLQLAAHLRRAATPGAAAAAGPIHPAPLAGLPFLGGVLHGLVRQVLFPHEPPSAAGAPACWRVLPPPARRQPGAAWMDAQGRLQFELLVHVPLDPRARATLCYALSRLQELGVGPERHPLAAVSVQALPLQWPSPGEPPPLPEAQAQPCRLRLQWCTPLHLVSRRQAQAGFGDAAPSLYRVLRSVAQRACALEPQWAAAWGLGPASWRDALGEVRPLAAGVAPDFEPFSWRYGSRAKGAAAWRRGQWGGQWFDVQSLPPLQQALLVAGAWLGVGEGASFGCGACRWGVQPLVAPHTSA